MSRTRLDRLDLASGLISTLGGTMGTGSKLGSIGGSALMVLLLVCSFFLLTLVDVDLVYAAGSRSILLSSPTDVGLPIGTKLCPLFT